MEESGGRLSRRLQQCINAAAYTHTKGVLCLRRIVHGQRQKMDLGIFAKLCDEVSKPPPHNGPAY